MRRIFLFLVAGLMIMAMANGQVTYYSKGAAVDFTDVNSWGTNADGSGAAPSLISNADSFVIQNASVMNLNAGNAAVKHLTINTGSLTISSNTLTVSKVTGNNSTLLIAGGSLTVSGGALMVNGNIQVASGSSFTHSGGSITVDGNSGAAGSSVPTGTPLLWLRTNNITLTGGTLTFIDPHIGTANTDRAITYTPSTSPYPNVTTGHTTRFGDGLSAVPGGGRGFEVSQGTRLQLGNVIVNTLQATSPVRSSGNLPILGNLTITAGEFSINNTLVISGNIINNGVLTTGGTLYFGSYTLPSILSPSANSQTVSGTGIFRNLTESPTANLNAMTVNNTNASGVTLNIPLSVSGTLTLTAGIVNTSTVNLLSLGTVMAAGTLIGGSTTAYIAGPFARTFAPGRIATGTYNAATLYPVGKTTSYLPIHIDPTTNSGGALQVRGEVFSGNSGTRGAGVTTLSANRWEALITNGAGNFISANIRLNDAAIAATNKIVQASTAAGVYAGIEPVTVYAADTLNSLTTTGTQIMAADYQGYFACGNMVTCMAPADQPTSFTTAFPGATSFNGSFTAATSAPGNYLVVRYLSPAIETAPADFTVYTNGSALGAGTVVSTNGSVSFNETGLTANTAYSYYIYSYNSLTCSGPVYRTANPLIGNFTTCASVTAAPGTITGSLINLTGFTVSWVASGTAGVTYELDIATNNTFTNVVSGYNALNTGSSLTYTATGLTSATTYYVRVRAVVAGCYSVNTALLAISTLCDPVTAYTENWDGAIAPAFPACFFKVINSLGAAGVQSANAGSAPNTLYIYSPATADQAVVALRRVSNAGANTHQLRFRARGNVSSEEILQVGYLANPADAATFTLLEEFLISALTYKEYVCAPGIAPGNNEVLAFRPKGTNGTSILIDDLSWEPLPACPAPSAAGVEMITAATASVNFTSPGNDFIVEYGSTGFAPGTGAAPGGGTVITGTASPVALSGLTANTTYDVYVRQVCNGTIYSANSTVKNFTTACNNYSLPVVQGFNTAGTSVFPACWTQQYVIGTNAIKFMTSSSDPVTAPFEGTRFVYWNSFNIPQGNETRLVSPPITTAGIASVDAEFYWFNQNSTINNSGAYLNEGVQVQYSLDGIAWIDAGAFIPRYDGTLPAGTSQWKKKIITLPAAAGNQPVIYVGFKFHSQTGDNCSLDAAIIKASAACATPSSENVELINSTTAAVSFISAGNSFIAEYGTAGFIPGTGATAGAGGTIVTGNASPITLTGLAGSTAYDVYIRQVCAGPSYSANSSVVHFTTLCAATGVPYILNFDNVDAPEIPPCTFTQNVNGGNTWRAVETDVEVSSSNIIRLDYEKDRVTPANDWFYTRALTLDAGTSYRLTFQYRNSNDVQYKEKLEVKYGTAPNAAAMTAGTLFTNTNIDFNTWREGGVDFTPSSTGIYYIGFHGFSDADNAFLAIDDIIIDVTPPCPPPIDAYINLITAATASVNFTPAGTNYIIEYGPAGFTPGTGATAGAGGTAVAVTSGQLPYTITGLTGSTGYQVYIRQVCTGPVYGQNSTKLSFTTPLINDDAPGAITLIVGSACTGEPFSNAGATQSENEPAGTCSGKTGYATVWYKFVAPASGAVRISTATGSGTNTLTDSRVALFSATDVNNYSTFNIISCDDDNGGSSYNFMSILYATGLTSGSTYYIQVDVSYEQAEPGTFCLTVDELNVSMLATVTGCETGQSLFGSVATYTGWSSLVDGTGKLIALVKNPSGDNVSSYTIAQNINGAAVRTDAVSGQRYLDRNFRINNSTATNVDVQFFFLNSELTALQAADAGTTLANMGVTRQTGSTCQPDFVAANGTNSYLSQTGNGTSADGLVKWIQVQTPAFSNFYLHSCRTPVAVKTFLQGAYSAPVLRHKNVTTSWAGILNANALNQPYNVAPFNYAGTESVNPGFFVSTAATTDIVDWVLLEIRNAPPPASPVASRAAFIREDGVIVDLDGVSSVSFGGLVSGSYYITIRHRNHLGVRTGTMQVLSGALGNSSSAALYDFSSQQSRAFQDGSILSNAAMADNGGVFLMWAGNANLDQYVRVTSLGIPLVSSDASYILGTILNGNPNLTVSGYSVGDINMDGSVRATSLAIPLILSDISFMLATPLDGNNNATRREHK